MTTTPSTNDAPTLPPTPRDVHILRLVLIGNPNTGKTTLFNRLTGLRHHTSNFPGTTLEARLGRMPLHATTADASATAPLAELIDLPGIYSLELDQLEAGIARDVLAGKLAPSGESLAEPDALCVIVDATNLPRNLTLVGEALRRRLPTVVALNMIDLARSQGLHIDVAALEQSLGCRVVTISARSGEGLPSLASALASPSIPSRTPPGTAEALADWADETASTCTAGGLYVSADSTSERLDRTLTHPILGGLIFLGAMAALFFLVFSIATVPMDLLDRLFASLGSLVESAMPEGHLRDLLVGGVIAGVGSTLIFLPQICLLFFAISILEDTGYLARAAFLTDRLLRPFGLPGHAFVPLLSSHACALPGIMACRGIPDRRERLATMLVAPFMTCSARIPVYVLLTGILFPDQPLIQALAFVGCYLLGIGAGVFSALLARRTILKGPARPMALELPTYKRPSLGTALLTTFDRAKVFITNAGTVILAISIVLWWLSTYPKVEPPTEATALRAHAQTQPPDLAEQTLADADSLERRHAATHSFAGRLGRTVQPIFAPLHYDWQLSIGVLSSFAAREVFVTTMAVIATGHEEADEPDARHALASAKRDDSVTPIFTRPVAWSLLVYYVLAMQCLPTLAVTARESGSWKWAALQLGWMLGVAYIAALITTHLVA